MQPNVLIIEDEARLLAHLSELLKEQGFSILTGSTLQDLKATLQQGSLNIDVVILDRLLQGQDSAELIEGMKASRPDTKILVLSAISTSSEKAMILDLGADDYLAKPFEGEELVARLRVLLRRSRPELSFGDLTLNSDQRTLIVQGQEIELQNKEFVLLRTLVQAPGKVFNKSFLYDHVWHMSTDVESNVIEATVNKLRRRLKEVGANVVIKNSRNAGYWIEE